jgi:chlorite dismutase
MTMAEATTKTSMKTSTYAVYWLFRADPAFARLAATKRELGKRQFLAALDERDPSVVLRGVYSFAGLRSDADLMIWALSQDLDAIQRLNVALRHTGLGAYLLPVETYVGVTTPARYDPEHLPAFMQGVPAKRYISVYPFVKTAEWYLLPYARRRELMGEHGAIGRRYAVSRANLLAAREHANGTANGANGANASDGGAAGARTATATKTSAKATAQVTTAPAAEEGGGVLASTVDAFGLGDYEFILANESDDPAELCRMMMDLRATEVRRYTRLDTPIFLGRLRESAEALAAL